MVEVHGEIYDVIVVGAGTAGWIAALAAARQNKKVLVIERKGYLGGALSSGLLILGFYDMKKRKVVEGYAEEFVERMKENDGCDGCFFTDMWHVSGVPLNGAVVKPTVTSMLLEAGVEVRMFSQVVDVIMEGKRIKGVLVQNKSEREIYLGRSVIDASGDATVACLAGVSMQPVEDFQPPTLLFRLDNVSLDELDEFLVKNPEVFYGKRFIPGRKITEDFYRNREIYLVFEDLIGEVGFEGDWMPYIDRFMFMPVPGTGRKSVVVNTLRGLFTDGRSSKSLTEATLQLYRNMLRLAGFFKEKIPGFSQCYLADSDPEIQLRETRRIVGEYTLKAEDIYEGTIFDDSVGLGCYYIDVHSSKDKLNACKLTDKAYGLPYRALLPGDVDGLLVAGRCISGTKEAAGSFRVMATCMAIGQAAGTAAALAVDTGVDPRYLNVKQLQETLRQERAILEL